MRNFILVVLRAINFKFLGRVRKAWHLANLPRFAHLGRGAIICPPFYSGNERFISIGGNCRIGPYCDLGVVVDEGEMGKVRRNGSIVIGDRVRITRGLQIFSAAEVVLEDDVLIASNVFICDYSHGYDVADVPYKDQGYTKLAPVRIGKGSWVGQNCVILQGITIGEYSIVGANSVVAKSIPPKSIAVGNPARVIKTWSEAASGWVPVERG